MAPTASLRPNPELVIWKQKVRPDRPKPYLARWVVGGREHSKAFQIKQQANDFELDLRNAARAGERFSESTGLPVAWERPNHTVATWAHEWFRANMPTWLPRSRRSNAEVLARALPILVSKRAAALDATALAALEKEAKLWLAGESEQPAYLQRWSLPLDELTKPLCAEAHAVLTTTRRGKPKPFAPEVSRRYRNTVRGCLRAAVEAELLSEQVWPAAPRTRRAATTLKRVAVTRREVPTVAEAVDALRRVRNRRRESFACYVFFAIMLYAGLRPSEVKVLADTNVVLPETGDEWGTLLVEETDRDAGDLWTADGEELGEPKAGSVREVLMQPTLVKILWEYMDGRAPGRLFETRHGNTFGDQNLGRAWKRANGGRWTVYALRHCCATAMLDGGVPNGTVAQQLGHSMETLSRVYIHFIKSNDEVSKQRIAAAFGRVQESRA